MNFPALLLVPTLALVLMLSGCQKQAIPDREVVFLVLRENLGAFEKKDVETVMGTIHPQSPVYESTREMVEEMFKSVDLKFTLSDLQIVTATPDEVKVSFVQKTERVGGKAQFQDNIVKGIHTLRPDKGIWKIYNTTQTAVTGVDGKPFPLPMPELKPQTAITPAEKTPPASQPAQNAPTNEPPK